LRGVRAQIEQVASTNATVLLLGETGTGKNRAAALLHALSARQRAPFISVDCASLPSPLIESELFGRERGAFTDARVTQPGRFEIAHGGTVFLDEVGELPLEVQAKLLRVLQCGDFERLGSPRTIHVDVRLVAATNRDLAQDVRNERFRRDLYYRLNVFPIRLPPLRERRDDIVPLVDYLIGRLATKYGRHIEDIPRSVIDCLLAYDWPGNVRELENVLERAIITSTGSTLRLAEMLTAEPASTSPEPATTLVDVERAHITSVLRACGWRIEGGGGAALLLGLKPSTLRSRMHKLGILRAESLASPGAFRVA
jgi:transcriptional regulator with GAF, ATPase, and Fis domain